MLANRGEHQLQSTSDPLRCTLPLYCASTVISCAIPDVQSEQEKGVQQNLCAENFLNPRVLQIIHKMMVNETGNKKGANAPFLLINLWI